MSHKVITIAQQKGGAGKTTLAAQLAVAFVHQGKKVSIIDVDPQASLGHWYDMREQTLGADNTGVEYAQVSGWRLHNEIGRISEDVDVVLIDSPPHTQTETKTAIRVADLVLIPVQPSPTDMWATDATIDIVSSERIPHRLVLNRVVKNSNLAKQLASHFSNLLDCGLGNRVAFAGSMLSGLGVVETEPSTMASSEINQLCREVGELLFPAAEDIEQTA